MTDKVDLTITGEDAAELAKLLRIPRLGDGRYGWLGLLAAAAALREMKVREVQANLGYEIVLQKCSSQG